MKVDFKKMQSNAELKGAIGVEFGNQLLEALAEVSPARHASEQVQDLKRFCGPLRHTGNTPRWAFRHGGRSRPIGHVQVTCTILQSAEATVVRPLALVAFFAGPFVELDAFAAFHCGHMDLRHPSLGIFSL